MPIGSPIIHHAAAIMAGHGPVSINDALTAFFASPGFVSYSKKTGLWDTLDDDQRREMMAIDADMPDGFWRYFQRYVPRCFAKGGKVRWHHGQRDLARHRTGYAVERDNCSQDLHISTPWLRAEDEELC